MAQLSRYYTYIEPVFKTPKTRAYTMLVLSLFAIAFFGFFAIRPTITTIIALQKEIGQAQEIDQKLAEKMAALDQAQQAMDKAQGQVGLLQQAIPTSPNVANILRVLENRALAAGVNLGSVQVRTLDLKGFESATPSTQSATLSGNQPLQPREASAGAAPGVVQLSFSIIGNEQSVRSFLQALQNSRRILTVDSIRIGVDDRTGSVIADVAVKGYYLE